MSDHNVKAACLASNQKGRVRFPLVACPCILLQRYMSAGMSHWKAIVGRLFILSIPSSSDDRADLTQMASVHVFPDMVGLVQIQQFAFQFYQGLR